MIRNYNTYSKVCTEMFLVNIRSMHILPRVVDAEMKQSKLNLDFIKFTNDLFCIMSMFKSPHSRIVPSCRSRLICINGSLGEMSLSEMGSRAGKPRGFGGYRNPLLLASGGIFFDFSKRRHVLQTLNSAKLGSKNSVRRTAK